MDFVARDLVVASPEGKPKRSVVCFSFGRAVLAFLAESQTQKKKLAIEVDRNMLKGPKLTFSTFYIVDSLKERCALGRQCGPRPIWFSKRVCR